MLWDDRGSSGDSCEDDVTITCGGRAREGMRVSELELERGGVLIMSSREEEEEPDLVEGLAEEGKRVEKTSWMRLGRTTDETSSAISLEVILQTTSLLFRVGESRSSTSSQHGVGVEDEDEEEKKREGSDGVNGNEDVCGGWIEGSTGSSTEDGRGRARGCGESKEGTEGAGRGEGRRGEKLGE